MNDKFDDMSRNIDSISISVIKPLEIQIRNYLDKLSDSQINEIGEPIDQEDLDKIMILRQKIENNFGDGAI